MKKFDRIITQAREKRRKNYFIYVLAFSFAALCLAIFVNVKQTKLIFVPSFKGSEVSVKAIQGVGFYFKGALYSLSEDLVLSVDSKTHAVDGYLFPKDKIGREAVINLQQKEVLLNLSLEEGQRGDWYLNGTRVSTSSSGIKQKIGVGDIKIEINARGYHSVTKNLSWFRPQYTHRFKLKPIKFDLTVTSIPPGQIFVNKKRVRNKLPIRLFGPKTKINVTKDGFFPVEDQVIPRDGETYIERRYLLKPRPVTLEVDLMPPNGTLIINGIRRAPHNGALTVRYEKELRILYSKPGFVSTRAVMRFEPGGKGKLKAHLRTNESRVSLMGTSGAEVTINGKKMGYLPMVIMLPTKPHVIKASKKGFIDQVKEIKFFDNSEQKVRFDLIKESEARLRSAPKSYKTLNGIEMILVRPSKDKVFSLGAPRHEKGQRANEFIRPVRLVRPFFVAKTELQNKDIPGLDPNDKKPVTNLAWNKVALFCNQLSEKERLKPFYKVKGGRIIGFHREGNGYRLISEAEWEYMARYHNRKKSYKFPWGNDPIVPPGAGNLGDENSKAKIKKYITGYTDPYVGLAPAAKFAPGISGLFDLVGNVSEWVHDVYDLSPPVYGEIKIDPLGPEFGASHVVKGSNYNSASITELRGSFRDGSEAPRADLGFRIARYL